jgi:ABC-2 type transport system permease protein
MHIFIATIKKEIRQLKRNVLLLVIICTSPVIILGIIPFSLENHVKISIGIVDQNQTSASRMMAYRMKVSPYYKKVLNTNTVDDALSLIRQSKNDMALVIPHNFEKDSGKLNKTPLLIALDGTHTLNAQSHLAFLEEELLYNLSGTGKNDGIKIHQLFNPELNGRNHFIVSLLILLVTLIGACLITINVVSEKESGMWAQLQATPLSMLNYLSAKFFVFALVVLAEMIVGLIFCRLVYSFHVSGSIIEYLLLTLFFSFPMLLLGLFIASISGNQVQAVYMLVFVLLTLILMSSMFSFLNSMPVWAQKMRFINPLYYMLNASRLMVLKGFSIIDIWTQAGMLGIQGLILLLGTYYILFRSRFS